jgi:hypothetical protein
VLPRLALERGRPRSDAEVDNRARCPGGEERALARSRRAEARRVVLRV